MPEKPMESIASAFEHISYPPWSRKSEAGHVEAEGIIAELGMGAVADRRSGLGRICKTWRMVDLEDASLIWPIQRWRAGRISSSSSTMMGGASSSGASGCSIHRP